MAKKKCFLHGLTPEPPETDDEGNVVEGDFKKNKIGIFVAGTIILAGFTKIFGVELPLPILLGCGAVIGVALYYLDRLIRKGGNKKVTTGQPKNKNLM
jgi:hypothetical protein